ncbi:MAG TPA: methionyl-tRNA formyltransferase [Opitutaceae bacterium]|nr:methionyl-tRNA formyltransferase [Opitutaceae bacterium]
MADTLRLVFMGSDPVALCLLDWLVAEGKQHADLVGIFTGVDRPSGRGQSVKPNSVKAWADAHNQAAYQPEKLDPAALEHLKSLQPDVVLVVAYGRILKDDFIAVPRLGTLNLHASLLPKYRGASPIQTAVAQGDKETGFALMRIVRELDAGPVAAVERIPIGPLDTALEVEHALAAAAAPLLARTLPLLASGSLEFVQQDHASATFCRRLEKADGVLDFTAPAPDIAARINGLHPWPSATVDVAGVAVKLGLADTSDQPALGSPGSVLGHDAHGVLVATGQGTLRLRRLQRPGGRMLEAAEFLRGFQVPAGTLLASQPMPPLVGAQPFRH